MSSSDYPETTKKEAAAQAPCAYGNVLATGALTPDSSQVGQSVTKTTADEANAVVSIRKQTDCVVDRVEAPDGYVEAPVHDSTQSARRDSFITGLCKSGGPCVEACCCYWCQISRQYNVLINRRRGLHCGVCCVLCCLDSWSLLSFGKCCQCYLRRRLRRRYRLRQNGCCGDCCTVFWCACCALSQTHWEMAMRGDDPGATCCAAEMQTQMR